MKTSTILATCYAINPYKGSEDAMGWNFVLQIAKYRKVIVITRENNRPAIEKYIKENPDEIFLNIQFLYFDLPYWARFWKKGSRGAMLYFYLWQRNIVGFIKKNNLKFDIAHNVNFHNDWTPTFLWKLSKPMVWGPVGHHPAIPRQYLSPYPFRYYIKDRITWLIKNLFWNFSPNLKKAVKKAHHIWYMNTGVAKVLSAHEQQYSVYPSVASEDFFKTDVFSKKQFNVMSVGRFVPLKGFDLTICSFAKFLKQISRNDAEKCKLFLIGKGPEKEMYQRLISKFRIENNVEIIEWLDREILMEKYKDASVFLFPSHEGAGMVVAEALSFGLPVVCLKNEGPGEFINSKCGFSVPHQDYEATVEALAASLLQLFQDKSLLTKMSAEARNLYVEKFSWEKRGEYLDKIYQKIEE